MDTDPTENPIRSPFGDVRSSLSTRKLGGQLGTQIIVGLLILILAAIGVYLATRHLADPLRTLKPFPTEDYYTSYSSLEGTRFRARLRFVSQLGWNEHSGRLVIFDVVDSGKPLVVLVEPKAGNLTLQPGDVCEAELRVTEGGLIRSDNLRSGN